MANNYIPNGELAVLVGDGSIALPTPQPTKVSGDKVNACVETQSTNRADIFMKPKTDAQIAAILNPTLGMVAVSSDSGKLVVREAAVWAPVNAVTGVLYQTVNLTTAQIIGMSAAPVVILAAPGVGKTYIVQALRFSIVYAGALFTGGGIINGQYGATALGGGEDATNAFAATFLTATAASKFCYMTGNDTVALTAAGTSNQSITLTNGTAPFAGGGTSTGKVEVWYSIV
jgi:hypothetical protein